MGMLEEGTAEDEDTGPGIRPDEYEAGAEDEGAGCEDEMASEDE
jgi:hypothetical protein